MRPRTILGLEYAEPEGFVTGQHLASVARLEPALNPDPFPEGERAELPESFEHEGRTLQMRQLLDSTQTFALLVLVAGEVRYEEYRWPAARDVQWNAFSAGKSLTSALVGIALKKGLIASLDERTDKYLPWLRDSDYGRNTIRNLLQMSSGMDGRDQMPAITSAAESGRVEQYLAGLRWVRQPGTTFEYVNSDPTLLGFLLRAATGSSVAQFMQTELWEPLGFESSGYLPLDASGAEITGGCSMFTARDFARLGELYRHNGAWKGRQIVPADYVRESTTVMAPHLAAGELGSLPFGYGHLWWLPEPGNDFTALGHFNQYIYVNPSHRTTIVKLSANINPASEGSGHIETMAALKAIAGALS
jgi:CubicO group peptidase (beta-lactamase class C family)